MNASEALATIAGNITDAVKKALKIKLEPGEVCPCCGHKKGTRKVSARMLAANRQNIKKAIEKIRKN